MSIPSLVVPTYEMTLPLTQEKIKYRPFSVKEEKILINASEQDDVKNVVQAVEDIVKNCTYNKIDAAVSPMFDVQYAFLQIRGKSIGEQLDFNLICTKCQTKIATHIGVDEFTLKSQIGHTNTISIGNGIQVKLKYPTFNHFIALFEDIEPDGVYQVVAECIDQIITSDEIFINDGKNIKELRDWVDALTPEQFEKLEMFFITMPILQKEVIYHCDKCDEDRSVVIDGIRNFFG